MYRYVYTCVLLVVVVSCPSIHTPAQIPITNGRNKKTPNTQVSDVFDRAVLGALTSQHSEAALGCVTYYIPCIHYM